MAQAITNLRRGPVVLTDKQEQPTVEDRALLDNSNSFVRGMRGAVAGLRAGSLARDELDALSDRDYVRAAGLQRERGEASRRGAAFGPRVTSLKDIHGVGDALEFAGGAAGQGLVTTAPAIAGSVGTALALKLGLGKALAPVVKPLVDKLPKGLQGYAKGLAIAPGGAAASIPMEAGEAAAELLNDPVARQNMTPQQLQDLATTKGLATALPEALVPSLAIGKLINNRAGRKTLRGAAAEGGATVAQEGLTEGTQNLIAQNLYKQANPDRVVDWQSTLDETVAGAIGGGGLALPGTALDAAQAIQQRSTETLATASREVIDLAKDSPLGKLAKDGFTSDETNDWLLGTDTLPDDMVSATDEKKAKYLQQEDVRRENFVVMHLDSMLRSGTEHPERVAEAQRLLDDIQTGENPSSIAEAAEKIVEWRRFDVAVDKVVEVVDNIKDTVKGFIDGPKKTLSSLEGTTLNTAEQSASRQVRRRKLITQALAPHARTSQKKAPVNEASELMRMLVAGELSSELVPAAKTALIDLLGNGFTPTFDAFTELHDAESTRETSAFGPTEEDKAKDQGADADEVVEEGATDFEKRQEEKKLAPPEFYGKTEGKISVFDSAFGDDHEKRVRAKLDVDMPGVLVQSVTMAAYAKEAGKDIIALANQFGKNRTDPEITTRTDAIAALRGKNVLRLTEQTDRQDIAFTEADVRGAKLEETTTYDPKTKKKSPKLGSNGTIFFTDSKGNPFAVNAQQLIFMMRGRELSTTNREGKTATTAEQRLLAGVVSMLGAPGVDSRKSPYIYKKDGTIEKFESTQSREATAKEKKGRFTTAGQIQVSPGSLPSELRITPKSATVGAKRFAKKKTAQKNIADRKKAGITPEQNVRNEQKIEKERRGLIEQAENLPFEAVRGSTTASLLEKVEALAAGTTPRAVMAKKTLSQLKRIVATREADVEKTTGTAEVVGATRKGYDTKKGLVKRTVATKRLVKATPAVTNKGEINEAGFIIKDDTDPVLDMAKKDLDELKNDAEAAVNEAQRKDVAFRGRTELTNVVRPPTRDRKVRGNFERAWLTATAAVVYPKGSPLHPVKVPATTKDIISTIGEQYEKTESGRNINELFNLQALLRSNIVEIQAAAVKRLAAVMPHVPDSFVDGFKDSSIGAIRAAANRVTFLRNTRQSRESSPGVTGEPATPKQVREAEEYIHKVLGKKIATEYVQDFGKSGEWQEGDTVNMIRLSINAGANMLNVARHEAMHEFFARLTKTGKGREDTREVLMNAANSPTVVAQLNRLLRGESSAKARAQIADGATDAAEERLSYMYQFWAAGDLTIGRKTETVFQKIAAFLRKITGFINNDEKAMLIVQAFHDGRLSTPSAAGQVLSDIHAEKGLQKALTTIKPVLDIGRSVAYTSDAMLRESGNSVLEELASRFNTPGTDTGEGAGYLNAKPKQISHWLNRFNNIISGLSNEDLALLHTSLQTNSPPGYPAGDKAFAQIHGMLSGSQREAGKGDRSFLQYMRDAGMHVNKRTGYYPVVWNAPEIMSRASEFKELLLKHHTKDLEAIAVHSNELAKQKAALRDEVVPTDELATAYSVADNIVRTLANDRGVPNLAENSARIGYSPHTIAIHKRKLDFLNRKVFGEFEHTDVISTLSTYLVEGVKHAEYVKRFGDAKSKALDGTSLASQMDKATKEEIKQHGAEQAEKNMAKYHKAVMAMEGTLGGDMSSRARQLTSTMLVYQNLRLLPLSLFASFVDPMGIIVRGGTVQQGFEAFKRGVREVVASYKKEGAVQDGAAELAERLGTVDQSIFLDTLGETYSSMYMTGWQKKLSDKLFRYNGMEGWNRGMRISATQTAIDFIKQHAANPGENSERWLSELGITAKDVQISENGALKMFEEDGLTMNEMEKIQTAVSRFVDSAILRPNAAQRPSWASDPRWALLFHLKQFTYSFQKVIIARALHEWKHGNPNAVLALASYVPFMIAADIIKGMLVSGGDEPDYKKGWGVGDYVLNGVERAGILGVGQFAVDTYQYGPEALSGPAFEQVIDLVSDPVERSFVRALPANALYRGVLQ